jgi:hypothetical protein
MRREYRVVEGGLSVSLDRLAGEVAQSGELCDGGNVIVRTVIGNCLHSAKQRQDAISLEQVSLGAMAREDWGVSSDSSLGTHTQHSLKVQAEIMAW